MRTTTNKVIDTVLLLVALKYANINYMFNKQKDYFKNKLRGIQAMIWDLEFKRYKTFYVREQIRQEYDNCRSRMEILKTQISSEAEKLKPQLPNWKQETDGKLETTQVFIKRNQDFFDKTPEVRKQIDEFGRLEDDLERLEKEVEKKVAQMKSLDIEVQGSKPTAELPEGHQGINETLSALHELIQVTKKYTKEL